MLITRRKKKQNKKTDVQASNWRHIGEQTQLLKTNQANGDKGCVSFHGPMPWVQKEQEDRRKGGSDPRMCPSQAPCSAPLNSSHTAEPPARGVFQ